MTDVELYIFRRHGLFWAGAEVESATGIPMADGLYVWAPERYSDLFLEISVKLRQLNDYCFHQLVGSEQKLIDLAIERNVAGSSPLTPVEDLDVLEDEVDVWTANVRLIGLATPVVLLSSFVERALRRVSAELTGVIPRNRDTSKSETQALVDHILLQGRMPELELEDCMRVVSSFRKVRNDFAHGKWEDLETELAGSSLRTCFEAVSDLFARLEAGAWESPWAARSTGA